MKLLVSGEGPSDVGACTNAQGHCTGENFAIGPMTVWLCRLWEALADYDLSGVDGALLFVSETLLAEKARQMPGRLQRLRGRGKPAETGLYFNNARQLGLIALEESKNGPVMAVLFRDTDGTRSAPGQLWQVKWNSMMDGFNAVGFDFGVPMLPKPKSEAWLLCAATQGHPSYATLEDISGNDVSPNSAKARLDAALGGHQSAAQLSDWCRGNPADWSSLLTMPSFKALYDRFQTVARAILRQAPALT